MKRALTPLFLLVASLPSLAWAQTPDDPAVPNVPVPVPVPVPDSSPSSSPSPSPSPAPYAYRAPAPLHLAAETAEKPRPQRSRRYDYFRFGAGFRVGYIGDSGFDNFANDDVLGQVALDASYAFFTSGKLAIAGGVAWDVGSRTAGARGLTTKLTMHRLTVPIEARWYFTPWFDVFAKVAPGAGALYARIEDPSSPATLEHAPWVFATDLSAGASFRLVGTSANDARHPRLWITHEVGYGLTTSHSLRPGPNRDEADVLGADERTNLGSLALNGVFWRTGLAVSF